MTAKEMFEELGLEQSKSPFKDCIEYGEYLRSHIIFDKTYKFVHANCTVSMKLLKAINKQCEELGWMNDDE